MTADFSRARKSEGGLALLVVLWGISAAALLVSAFNVVVRSGATFVTSEIELTQAEALADAGLEIAAAHLIDEDQVRRWRPDGAPRRLALADAELTITIYDPNGLVDVNKASDQVLLGLLRRAMDRPDEAEGMLQRILALRGAPSPEPNGDSTSRRPAESPKTPSPAQLSSKPQILDVTDLRRMEGMTRALYSEIAPYLTVYSRDGRINPYRAPRTVLAALPGLTEADIDRFLAQEGAGGGNEEVVPGSLGKAGAFLSAAAGPAVIVSVTVGKPGKAFLLGRQFVIALGLDTDAPYRLIATKPLSPDSSILQERGPNS